MKKITLIASCIALISLSACNNEKAADANAATKEISTDLINNPSTAAEDAPAVDPENAPQFEFEETVIEFGEISQGEKVKRMFKFTNVGKSDLIISDAKGSCGCTVPVWPRNPIAPGEGGEIEVVFDSKGKAGRQNKTVTLVANTVPNTKVLAIKGDVLAPTQPETETPAE